MGRLPNPGLVVLESTYYSPIEFHLFPIISKWIDELYNTVLDELDSLLRVVILYFVGQAKIEEKVGPWDDSWITGFVQLPENRYVSFRKTHENITSYLAISYRDMHEKIRNHDKSFFFLTPQPEQGILRIFLWTFSPLV